MIFSIDPGTNESGWCIFINGKVFDSGVSENKDVLERCKNSKYENLAIERIASYGMSVGREVFETCEWVGRFQQAWRSPDDVKLIYRRDVKLHLCGTTKAKDANIRQALIDLLGPQGTKKAQGATYGVKSHAWAALGVAVTVAGITPESRRGG